jgi:hypothetical protein
VAVVVWRQAPLLLVVDQQAVARSSQASRWMLLLVHILLLSGLVAHRVVSRTLREHPVRASRQRSATAVSVSASVVADGLLTLALTDIMAVAAGRATALAALSPTAALAHPVEQAVLDTALCRQMAQVLAVPVWALLGALHLRPLVVLAVLASRPTSLTPPCRAAAVVVATSTRAQVQALVVLTVVVLAVVRIPPVDSPAPLPVLAVAAHG